MSVVKRTFKADFLRDIAWEDHDEDVKVLQNEISDTSRWSVHYDLVFEYEGKLYQTFYRVGATESQDEKPFEYEDEVECMQVEAFEKTVIDYRPVEE